MRKGISVTAMKEERERRREIMRGMESIREIERERERERGRGEE